MRVYLPLRSILAGLWRMRWPYVDPQPQWGVRSLESYRPWFPAHPAHLRFWVYVSTPAWHRGRGPYVSIGLGRWAIYRGY